MDPLLLERGDSQDVKRIEFKTDWSTAFTVARQASSLELGRVNFFLKGKGLLLQPGISIQNNPAAKTHTKIVCVYRLQ